MRANRAIPYVSIALLIAAGWGTGAGAWFWNLGTPATPHPAVARVIALSLRGASLGTGTLVAVNEHHGLIITNWHVIRDAQGAILVQFPDGFASPATVLKVDREWDLAALAIWRPRAKPVAIAVDPPRPGDVLMIAGYGQGDYRISYGPCTQYLSPSPGLPAELVELRATARQGDSGGPIFNVRGELVGVLFGSSFSETMGAYCGRVRAFLFPLKEVFDRLPPPDPSVLAATTLGPPGMTPVRSDARGGSAGSGASPLTNRPTSSDLSPVNFPLVATTPQPARADPLRGNSRSASEGSIPGSNLDGIASQSGAGGLKRGGREMSESRTSGYGSRDSEQFAARKEDMTAWRPADGGTATSSLASSATHREASQFARGPSSSDSPSCFYAAGKSAPASPQENQENYGSDPGESELVGDPFDKRYSSARYGERYGDSWSSPRRTESQSVSQISGREDYGNGSSQQTATEDSFAAYGSSGNQDWPSRTADQPRLPGSNSRQHGAVRPYESIGSLFSSSGSGSPSWSGNFGEPSADSNNLANDRSGGERSSQSKPASITAYSGSQEFARGRSDYNSLSGGREEDPYKELTDSGAPWEGQNLSREIRTTTSSEKREISGYSPIPVYEDDPSFPGAHKGNSTNVSSRRDSFGGKSGYKSSITRRGASDSEGTFSYEDNGVSRGSSGTLRSNGWHSEPLERPSRAGASLGEYGTASRQGEHGEEAELSGERRGSSGSDSFNGGQSLFSGSTSSWSAGGKSTRVTQTSEIGGSEKNLREESFSKSRTDEAYRGLGVTGTREKNGPHTSENGVNTVGENGENTVGANPPGGEEQKATEDSQSRWSVSDEATGVQASRGDRAPGSDKINLGWETMIGIFGLLVLFIQSMRWLSLLYDRSYYRRRTYRTIRRRTTWPPPPPAGYRWYY